MDDGFEGGFHDGNPITYKLYDKSTPKLMEVNSVEFPYAPDYAYEVFNSLETNFVVLAAANTIDQQHNFQAGWNVTSFANVPANNDLQSILMPLIENENLIKAIDEQGNIIENMSWGWVNDIGDMSPTEGYYVKVMEDQSMTVTGTPVELPYDIPLIEGWNISGYPAMVSQDAMTLLDDLIDAGILEKVIDEQGNIIQEMSWGWINNIGTFDPGEGYHIKVNQDCTMVIPEPSNAGGSLPQAYVTPEADHFEPVYEGNPYDPMQVVVNTEDLNLQEGDELALFSEGACVGAAGYKPSQEHQYLTASKDDPTTTNVDGFTEGANVEVKVYHKQTGEEQQLPYETLEGTSSFSSMATLVVEARGLATGVGTPSAASLTLDQNQPNPFSNETIISYNLPENGKVVLDIYNMHGQKLSDVVEKTQQEGTHSVTINGNQLSPGVYIYRLTYTNSVTGKQQTRMRKMTILK